MNLMKITGTLWAVEDHGNVSFGTRKEAMALMQKKGAKTGDLIIAFEEMLKNNHNLANFGVMHKTFIYSKYDEEVEMLRPIRGVA